MKQKFYYSIVLGVLMAFSTVASAQNTDPEWTLLQDDKGVKIYYASGICGASNQLWLKAENSNAGNVMAHFTLSLTQNGQTRVLPPSMLNITGNSSVTVDCNRTPQQMPIPVNLQNTAFTLEVKTVMIQIL